MTKTFEKGELLSISIKIAVDAHHGQFDRAKRPYILHPLYVLSELFSEDEEIQSAAVLHDVIEDCKRITWKYLIEQGIPDRTIKALMCLTRMPGQTEEEYEDRVLSNVDACKVKRKDLKHNTQLDRLKGITDKDMQRNIRYMKFAYRIDQKLGN